jgi:SAM-dependent methyltransferase
LLEQGTDVNRLHPHFFHREYWVLRYLAESITAFVESNKKSFAGREVLDFGSGDSPYQVLFRTANCRLREADIDGTGDVIAINPSTGRMDSVPDNRFAGLISTQVLEHVIDVSAYLQEAFRVLSPGGIMFLSTHGTFRLHRHPTDLRRWTTDGLKYDTEQAGFIVEQVEPRLGLLATCTHMRAMTFGALARKPITSWIPPIAYFFMNIRMAFEEWITPKSTMELLPEIIMLTARKPMSSSI